MKKLVRPLFWTLLLLPLVTVLLVLGLALQGEPAAPLAGKADAERLLQIKSRLARQDPRQLPPGGVRVVALERADLELLIGQALAHFRPAGAALTMRPHEASLAASIALRRDGSGPWLNLRAELRETGGWPEVQRLRLGQLPVPRWVAVWALRELVQRMSVQAEADLAVDLIKHIGFAPQQLSLSYEWRQDSLDQMLSTLWPRRDVPLAEAYNGHLVRLCQARKPGEAASLAELLPAMFELVRQRTAAGAEPGRENLTALLTLALHASGQHWSKLLPAARAWPRAAPLLLTLDQRDDFAQHFLISTVLAIEGGGPLADAIGIYKEVADSHGGSGFSFNDIAADRAGTQLGLLAASDPLRLQMLLLKPGLRELDFMPVVADLPEFLSDADFKSRYGGVGGLGYQQMLASINARVAALPFYRGN
ncbi:hypothetical protein RQP53_22115 [Paucibacter sp. APW11]|uniref:Transglycosylase SLT domain-containing protein n=1 Tax=Roseateles aquae TaxID=3077235 RepID=A0ABU3PHD6_9BURK|nr:hypothetical protein [Paucibacter sp. APW11]MDT9001989.1 hypothetical protein [Paucibacter sp. APW11]